MIEEIKIRELKRKDRKTVAAMIKKLADKVGTNGLLNIIVSDPSSTTTDTPVKKDDVFTRIGVELIKMLLDVLEDDVAAWFSDLIGKSPEEFDEMPFDVEMIIIEQLMEAQEANSFFTRALRAYSKIKTFAPGLSTAKTA